MNYKRIKYLINRIVFMLLMILFAVVDLEAQPVEVGRTIVPFNDQWEFKKVDNKPGDENAKWEFVELPHTWNAVDMQITKDYYHGDALYKKEFTPLPAWKDKRVFIRFEGVGAKAGVYINNKLIGDHCGAYSAFCFEITHELRFGETNTLLVKANNDPVEDIIPINDNLFGVYGGIYRNVSLIVTEKLSFTNTDYASPGVFVRQQNVSASSADITITTKVENREGHTKEVSLESTVFDAQGNIVKRTAMPVKVFPQGLQTFQQRFSLKQPHLWNGMDDPYLYKIIVSIRDKGNIHDQVVLPLGIRKFEIIDGKGFFLNGRPYRLHGVNRHQDWWGYGAAISDSQHAYDLALIKEIGANSIRLSHYQHAEYFYSKADSLGFLIWAEIPFVNAVSGKEAENAKQQLTELIRQNYHHPSIYVWGLHNEIKDSSPDDYASVLTATLDGLAKTEDPDRYTVSVNGNGEMERPENGFADLQGINRYFGWYEKTSMALEDWVKDLEQRFPGYKVILSEYGCEGNVNQQDENPPDSVNPTEGQYYPEQLETRLHEIQWGIIARHPYLLASYVWTMFDFAIPGWNRGGVPARNQKGLVTFDRKIKKDAFYWYKANWSKEAVLYISDRRLIERKNANTKVTVYSNRGEPILFVNNMPMQRPKQGSTPVHFIFDNVTLKKGMNTISVIVKDKGREINDEVQWELK